MPHRRLLDALSAGKDGISTRPGANVSVSPIRSYVSGELANNWNATLFNSLSIGYNELYISPSSDGMCQRLVDRLCGEVFSRGACSWLRRRPVLGRKQLLHVRMSSCIRTPSCIDICGVQRCSPACQTCTGPGSSDCIKCASPR